MTIFLACFFGSWIGTTVGLVGAVVYAAYKTRR